MATQASRQEQAAALGGAFMVLSDDITRLGEIVSEEEVDIPTVFAQKNKIFSTEVAMLAEREIAVAAQEKANRAVRNHAHSYTKNGKKVDNPENDLDRTWNDRLDVAAAATKRVHDIDAFSADAIARCLPELLLKAVKGRLEK